MADPAPIPIPPEPTVAVESEPVHTLAHVDQYLQIAQESGASDIHLGVNAQPILATQRHPRARMAPGRQTQRQGHGCPDREFFERRAEANCWPTAATSILPTRPSFGRFRASVVRQRIGTDLVFRVIATKLRSMDELGLPESLKLLTQYHNGLVLVTGSVGSGKSTTLAALVDEVNRARHDHIITLEDPIEYIIESRNCHVTQREVHTHTRSFAAALRGSLREDPDVIMVGEMRDLETIQLAITASETGHLVMGTLHTGNASRTLDRVLDVFPTDQRDQIRIMVSESLRGIVSQQLVPRKDGRAGRSPWRFSPIRRPLARSSATPAPSCCPA